MSCIREEKVKLSILMSRMYNLNNIFNRYHVLWQSEIKGKELLVCEFIKKTEADTFGHINQIKTQISIAQSKRKITKQKIYGDILLCSIYDIQTSYNCLTARDPISLLFFEITFLCIRITIFSCSFIAVHQYVIN